MKAIVKSKGESPKLVDIPKPQLKNGEVLVKVEYAGICKTDIKVANGTLPHSGSGVVLGHEFSGTVVEKAPDVGSWMKIGSFVTAYPMFDDCSDRMLGKDVDGCFAEYVAVPFQNIIFFDDEKMMRFAAYTEPVAAARAIAPKIPYAIEETVIAGNPNDRIAKLIKYCVEPDHRTIGRKLEIIDPEQLMVEIDIGKRKMPRCIVECCPDMVGKLVKYVEPGGCIVLKSRGYVSLENVLINDIVMREITLVGAKYDDFGDALEFILFNPSTIRKLIDKRNFRLDQFEEAFAEASKPDAKKVMFKCAQ